jgi:hypothetical protein
LQAVAVQIPGDGQQIRANGRKLQAIAILVEMVHDARIIRLKGGHCPAHVKKWMGDSSS